MKDGNANLDKRIVSDFEIINISSCSILFASFSMFSMFIFKKELFFLHCVSCLCLAKDLYLDESIVSTHRKYEIEGFLSNVVVFWDGVDG